MKILNANDNIQNMSHRNNGAAAFKQCSKENSIQTLFLSLMEPLPRTEILAPVSSCSLLIVLPWGPKSLPTKLTCAKLSKIAALWVCITVVTMRKDAWLSTVSTKIKSGYGFHIQRNNTFSTVAGASPFSDTACSDCCKTIHAETSLVGHWAHDLPNSGTAKLAKEGVFQWDIQD